MKILFLLLLSSLMFTACSDSGGEAAGEGGAGDDNYSSGNPVTAPADYLGAMGQAKRNTESKLNLMSVNQAIDLYSTAEGRYPTSLQQLVDEGYLAAIPQAPAGQKLEYNPTTGAVALTPVEP